jgi:hypothetical protein
LELNLERVSREHWAQDVKMYFVMRGVVPCSPTPPEHRKDGNQGRTQPAALPTHPARRWTESKAGVNLLRLLPQVRIKPGKSQLSCDKCVYVDLSFARTPQGHCSGNWSR